jgi:hypothetical protein
MYENEDLTVPRLFDEARRAYEAIEESSRKT